MIYFTSDQHYNHKNIIEYCSRPFKDVDDMNRSLIERHNAVVSKEDTVWHLGDFSLSEKVIPDILPQLNGKHYLVAGNHDGCFRKHKKHKKIAERYIEFGFLEVHQEIVLEGFLINHLPYLGECKEVKYGEYRPQNKGMWLLHGHIHNLWKVNGKMINVGVDVWDYSPVSIDTIRPLTT